MNRNHGIVQDALVNESSTLALMIVQESASQVAFYAERLRAWFLRKGLNAIEERDDEDRGLIRYARPFMDAWAIAVE